MIHLVPAVLAGALVLAGAPPAVAAGTGVDLNLYAHLERRAYLPAELVTLDVTITNEGTATASAVVVRSDGDLAFDPWERLDPAGPGIELLPGQSVSLTLTAAPNDHGNGMRQRLEVMSSVPDQKPADNVVSFDAFVTGENVDLDLTVYGDADQDGVPDPGEGRAGVQVTIFGGLRGGSVATRTDDLGVAHFAGIAGGEYHATVNLPQGWYLDRSQNIDVRDGHNTLALRATRVDFATLTPTVALDRPSYAPGDTVREKVTLTNSGATDISGIVAHCGGFGADNLLNSSGWGELDPAGQGVVVPAGETRTWEFTDVVPVKAWDYGFVLLQCDFSFRGSHDGPVAEAQATIPGGRGSFAGEVVDAAEVPLPSVKMLMIEPTSGHIAARATSDESGRIMFPALPAARYELRPVGPWRLYSPPFTVQVWAGRHLEFGSLVLEPGPTQLDPDAAAPPLPPAPAPGPVPDPGPTPQRVTARPLADTGADVVELTALGLLMVLAGAGLRLARRPHRRR